MGLAERIDRLEPRERQLLGIFVAVLAVLVLLLVPVGIRALVGSQRADVRGLRSRRRRWPGSWRRRPAKRCSRSRRARIGPRSLTETSTRSARPRLSCA